MFENVLWFTFIIHVLFRFLCIKLELFIAGAYLLQNFVKKFDSILTSQQDIENKTLDNVINVIAHLYSFKVRCN